MRKRSSIQPVTGPVAPPVIEIAAPDDIRDFVLVREDGETDENYLERNRVFSTLLTLGGA